MDLRVRISCGTFGASHLISLCLNFHICKARPKKSYCIRLLWGLKDLACSSGLLQPCTPGPQSTTLCIALVTDNYHGREPWPRDESSFPLHPPCPGAWETEHLHGNSGSWSLDKRSWSRAAAATATEEPAQRQRGNTSSPSLAFSSQHLHWLVSASDFFTLRTFMVRKASFQ